MPGRHNGNTGNLMRTLLKRNLISATYNRKKVKMCSPLTFCLFVCFGFSGIINVCSEIVEKYFKKQHKRSERKE